jgi:LmbE family N-acetylglucosaminyl deacetylase
VHILCYTHGEASTLNENDTDLDREREAELQQASTELAAATVTLLDYPDGGLAAIPAPELAAHAVGLAARHRPDGVLVSTTPASPVIQITRRLPALPCRRHLSRPAGACLGPPRGDR